MRNWIRKHKWELTLYVLFLALYAVFTRGIRGPIVYPDEAGYLGWARLFAGQGGDGGLHYFPAYGAFLAPLAAIFRDIRLLYPAVLIANGFLCSLLPVGIYCLSSSFLSDRRLRMLAAIAVGLYPTYLMYANLALCENLMAVGFVWLILSVRSLNERGKLYGVLFWSVILPLTHTRAFALLPAVAVILFLRLNGKKRYAAIGAAAVVFAAGVAYLMLNRNGVNTAHLRGQVEGLFSLDGLFSLVTVWCSQQLYLCLSTFGFYLFGWSYGLRLILRRERGWQTVLFLLLSVLLTGALSALYLSHHARPVHLFYGRYNDFILSGMLLLGIAGWSKRRSGQTGAWLIWAGLTAVAWAVYRTSLAKIGNSIINALGIFLYRVILSRFDVLLASLFFAAIAAILLLIGRRRRSVTAAALCVVYLITGALIGTTHFDADPRYGEPDHVALIRARDPAAPVLIDGDPLEWMYDASRVYAPEMTLREEDMGQDYLLTTTYDPTRALISSERRMDLYLYARNEQTAQWYRERGWLLSEQERFSGTVELKKADEKGLTFLFKNTGDPWLCAASAKAADRAVRIGISVWDGDRLVRVERRDLPCNLLRGETTEITVEAAQRVTVEAVRDFSDAVVSGAALTVTDAHADAQVLREPEHTLFFAMLTEDQKQGFYHQYAGREAKLSGLHLDTAGAQTLSVQTEQPASFRLFADGEELTRLSAEGCSYTFALDGRTKVEELAFSCECTDPFAESGLPQWLSFLSVDSRILPAAAIAERVPQWNHHEFGAGIVSVTVGKETGR